MKDFNFLGLVEEVREKERVEEGNKKLNYSKYTKKIKENPTKEQIDNGYVKFKGLHGNRKIIILNCDNCGVNFEKTKHLHNQNLNKNCKNFFCDKDCFNEFIKAEQILIKCNYCFENINMKLWSYNERIKNGNKNFFCGHECHGKFLTKIIIFNCNHCNKEIEKRPWEINDNNNYYCDYNCLRKRSIAKRSALELYLEEKTNEFFPNIEYIPSERNICENLELDFYFPDLSIAIEINGIHHYKDIFGQLLQRQEFDKAKNQICKEKNIKLYTLKSIENFASKGIKERDWKIFKNILMSKIPYCETKEDCISELYNHDNKILDGLIIDYEKQNKELIKQFSDKILPLV